MAFQSNPLNFPQLPSKGTPVGADIIMIADSAASNALKQCLVSSLPGASGITSAKAYGIALLFGR